MLAKCGADNHPTPARRATRKRPIDSLLASAHAQGVPAVQREVQVAGHMDDNVARTHRAGEWELTSHAVSMHAAPAAADPALGSIEGMAREDRAPSPASSKTSCVTDSKQRQLTVVLFDGFELLDVFGPLEVFGVIPQWFTIHLVAPEAGPVRSAQGPAIVANVAYRDATTPDIVLVPGGMGTRELVVDAAFLGWLRGWATDAEIVSSVCTGSGVLAAAGLLDGHRATSNKFAFGWATQQSARVRWVREARWVQDGSRWTSSGVSAGIDMAFALLAHLHGEDAASAVSNAIEYERHRDSSWDPFAGINSPAQ